jgi:hypothetical protein
MTWDHLDKQMAAWSGRLESELKISSESSPKLATSIAADVRFLSADAKAQLRTASPVPLRERLDELKAFQGWMDYVGKTAPSPFITRAQVITQNYICFVYLPESCFRVLAKIAPPDSPTKKCARFLSDNPVRAFRNAMSHANWTYRGDFQAIVYWARKGSDPTETLERFEVAQEDLSFWQSLSRCVAYAAFSNL